MHTIIFRVVTTLIIAVVAIALWPGKVQAAQNGVCQTVSLAVSLAPGKVRNQTLSGAVCTPTTWAPGERQVDVLVHGGTYDREYWDWQFQPEQYSYVEKTLAAGRATFAYDRLGVGSSSRPLGAAVTLEVDAYALHQAVQWLRSARGYAYVNLEGHSLGSAVVIKEAATYKDVDRVIVTGLLHTPTLNTLSTPLSFYPAMLDPAFSGLLDPTYLTTQPGQRGQLFYNRATADPAVIAYDEAHKDKAAPQLGTALYQLEVPLPGTDATGITAPVLIVMGADDTLICSPPSVVDCADIVSIAANEAAFYANAESLTVSSIPGSGHNLTLHSSAPAAFAAINQWITTH
jgi:pimeloyl-ACP methyl ester carboxylesterase